MAPVAKIPALKLFASPGSGDVKVQSSTVRPAQSCTEMPIATCSPREKVLREVMVAGGHAGERAFAGENLTGGGVSSMPRIVTEVASRMAMSPRTNSSPGLLRGLQDHAFPAGLQRDAIEFRPEHAEAPAACKCLAPGRR